MEVIPNEESPNEQKDEVRYECPQCKRKFKREAYAKHVPICARVFQGKKEIDNPKLQEIKGKLDNPGVNNKSNNKGFNKKKWENQSNELRAIIQHKRAEKGKYKWIFIIKLFYSLEQETKKAKNEPIIEIETKKNDSKNNVVPQKKNSINVAINSTNLAGARQVYSREGDVFYECELCNKKFTKINYESHLFECKQKYKDKKNNTFNNKPNFGVLGGGMGSPVNRRPLMPAVQYGGFSNKPNFNMKFGKHWKYPR